MKKLVKTAAEFKRGDFKKNLNVGIYAKIYFPTEEDWFNAETGFYLLKKVTEGKNTDNRPYLKILWNREKEKFALHHMGDWSFTPERALAKECDYYYISFWSAQHGGGIFTGKYHGNHYVQIEWMQLKKLGLKWD